MVAVIFVDLGSIGVFNDVQEVILPYRVSDGDYSSALHALSPGVTIDIIGATVRLQGRIVRAGRLQIVPDRLRYAPFVVVRNEHDWDSFSSILLGLVSHGGIMELRVRPMI